MHHYLMYGFIQDLVGKLGHFAMCQEPSRRAIQLALEHRDIKSHRMSSQLRPLRELCKTRAGPAHLGALSRILLGPCFAVDSRFAQKKQATVGIHNPYGFDPYLYEQDLPQLFY